MAVNIFLTKNTTKTEKFLDKFSSIYYFTHSFSFPNAYLYFTIWSIFFFQLGFVSFFFWHSHARIYSTVVLMQGFEIVPPYKAITNHTEMSAFTNSFFWNLICANFCIHQWNLFASFIIQNVTLFSWNKTNKWLYR